jgi:hypothetical protein
LLRSIPLFYLEWDEFRSEASPFTSAQHYVGQDELFLRKLVNATWIDQRIWEHISHETDERGQALIYVKPWKKELHAHGEAIDQALHRAYAPGEGYRVNFIAVDGQANDIVETKQFQTPLEVAELLLDHYRFVANNDYEIILAVFDQNRKTTSIFLRPWEED